MSQSKRGSTRPSTATLLYRPSISVDLQGYIQRAVVYWFLLVVLPFLVYVNVPTGVCRYFSSSVS